MDPIATCSRCLLSSLLMSWYSYLLVTGIVTCIVTVLFGIVACIVKCSWQKTPSQHIAILIWPYFLG